MRQNQWAKERTAANPRFCQFYEVLTRYALVALKNLGTCLVGIVSTQVVCQKRPQHFVLLYARLDVGSVAILRVPTVFAVGLRKQVKLFLNLVRSFLTPARDSSWRHNKKKEKEWSKVWSTASTMLVLVVRWKPSLHTKLRFCVLKRKTAKPWFEFKPVL